jgi:hypothetical protein
MRNMTLLKGFVSTAPTREDEANSPITDINTADPFIMFENTNKRDRFLAADQS